MKDTTCIFSPFLFISFFFFHSFLSFTFCLFPFISFLPSFSPSILSLSSEIWLCYPSYPQTPEFRRYPASASFVMGYRCVLHPWHGAAHMNDLLLALYLMEKILTIASLATFAMSNSHATGLGLWPPSSLEEFSMVFVKINLFSRY